MQLKEQDPNGLILTVTAVLVVFSSLLMLVVVFRSIGKFMQGLSNRNKQKGLTAQTEYKTNTRHNTSAPKAEEVVAITLALQSAVNGAHDEIVAAISMALRSELEQQHDNESYVLTFRRRPSKWNDRIQSMRTFNY